MNSIPLFNTEPFLHTLKAFFEELNVPVDYIADEPVAPADMLGDKYKPTDEAHRLIDEVYALGIVNDAIFKGTQTFSTIDQVKNISADYDGLLLIGVTLKNRTNGLTPTRSQLAEITRAFNRAFPYTPVTVVFRYNNFISFANTERIKYKQEWREGEKMGKVTLLKGVNTVHPHSAHIKILSRLSIDTEKIDSFKLLYAYWQSVFSVQALNDQFYSDLQDWFYYAIQNIILPFKPDYIDRNENIKNFLVRLLARTLFCWFVKEKGLIHKELLELTDWQGNRYKLTSDIDDRDFLKSNSYYRGVLQNIFFNALNKKEKKTLKDFGWQKYLNSDFDVARLTSIPYLNGGIFDKLDEDNAKESIEDAVIQIPNFLFYGIETEEEVTTGRGARVRTEIRKVEHKGLNNILKSYKFTLDENTPYEEDIALDPEMLGLVFENLLAELDPNLDESTINSIRKLTGSFYTPRKTIFEMVNDSLFLYLVKYLTDKNPQLTDIRKQVSDLVYFNNLNADNKLFCKAIVNGLDKFKMLDPACGSGAFPMGMLHRMVDILKMVDPHNELWIELKLNNVDAAQRSEFKKVLSTHLDDYGRKLGIIRDSIYGIDIQPMAVQITKLRFFISLLIDQKIDKGITPMPNIETKIICADSLKNVQADLFSYANIEQLTEARTRYYQPDISHEERESIATEIVEILDEAFPNFSLLITGKRIVGQNRELLKHWFTHSTLAAPFFNVDFFYPELKEHGGFDCVIGNPPYGGMKISDEVRTTLMVESKDPYGAFIARFLSDAQTPTPLKHGGILSFIVSDTFMTIKSHLPLRKLLMQNYVHKMIRVHPDTFRATVNTVIMIAERNTRREFDENHTCLMADLTNISIYDNYDRFVEILNQTKLVDNASDISNTEYAIYRYPQSLIRTNSNLPFFVASLSNFQKTKRNFSTLSIYVDEMCGGIKSYDDKAYIKNIYGNMGYDSFDKELIINRELSRTEKQDGIPINDFNKEKYYIKYEKGGDTINEIGILNNYFKPVEFYFPWDKKTVREVGSNNGLRNKHRYFSKGIGVSTVGVYAPIFRYCEFDVFFNNYNIIFLKDVSITFILLSVLCSRFFKYYLEHFENHTVAKNQSDILNVIIPNNISELTYFEKLSKKIISNLHIDINYDYASHEQIEIDKLVYEAYGLNAEDVEEVENWYARRYVKLSAAQKANLRALGKSDDYLELYGLR